MSLSLDKMDVAGPRAEKAVKPKRKHAYRLLLLAWVFLISCGVMGTKLYSDHLREQIAGQISTQTENQLKVVQQDYQKQMEGLKTNLNGEMSALQAKVDSLTELLAFAKDSATDKTDNSNQLYTQLEEVKKQLDELKKNLDVLK